MRILYSHRTQSRDGQSVHIEELVAALRAEGHEVLVVGPAAYARAGFGGESRWIAALRRALPRAAAELAELAYNGPAYLRLARAAAAFRPDVLYERYSLYYLAGTLLARRRGLGLVLEVNAPLAEERAIHGGLALGSLARRVERRTWRAADLVLAVTGVLRDRIAGSGVSRDRIRVVPNGIDPARHAAPPAVPAAPANDPLVLGFVGFVRVWHGLDQVVAALAADAGHALALTVVGDGPAREGLARQAAILGIAGRVRFTGTVPHDDVPAIVAGFDIALQPRVVDYASPLKIFDYMAAGRAIVAPDQPNIRELLAHERTALLFDPAREGALWEAVLRLAGDPALRARLGEAARAEIRARDYTWRGNARRVAAWASTLARRENVLQTEHTAD